MPTYQYACKACDHRFEAVQSFSDAALTECPACAGTLRKVFNAVGIVFKGSGFYRTDSRSGKGKNGSSGSESSASGASTSSGSSGSSSANGSSGSNGKAGSSGSSGSSSSSAGTPATTSS